MADSTVTLPDLLESVRAAARGLISSEDALGHMNCSEVQPVLDLLKLAGMPDLAATVLYYHAAGGDDEESDQHHDIYRANDEWSPARGGANPQAIARAVIDAMGSV